MSAIFGEFSRTERPVDLRNLGRMAAALPWDGADGGAQWSSAQVSLGRLLHAVTPESRYEQQPLMHASGRCVLVANARLDNRAALIDQLRIAPHADAPLTDPDLILAAYMKWGEECPTRLLGDFAFALWDIAQQRLVCVRDQLGIAPFYYHLSGARFIFASDIRAVLAHAGAPAGLNDTAVALHLCYRQNAMPSMTFRAGVKKLLPGRVLTVTTDSVRERVYWTPNDAPTVHLPNATAYAEQLRFLLDEAVRSRLRSHYPVGAHVSGGLDSSAIAVLAQQQLQDQGQTLTGFSWLPSPQTAAEADAPEYVATRRVEALGIPVETVELTAEAVCTGLAQDISLDGYTDLWYEPLVRARARERGIRVLLSGWGGDEVVSSSGKGYLAELFWRGHWRQLAQLISARSHGAAKPWRRGLGLLYGQIWLPSLPGWLQTRWPGVAPKRTDSLTCMAPAFATTMKNTIQAPPPTHCAGVRATQVRRLTAGHLQARSEVWASQGARDGIEYRYPLLDRRLVEFCLGAPGSLFFDRRQTRWLFRQAVADLLPDEIRLANLKLEARRVTRFLEVMEAALAQWWANEDQEQAAGIDDLALASRYLDLHCVMNGATSQNRIGALLGRERQIQVLVMVRAVERERANGYDVDA